LPEISKPRIPQVDFDLPEHTVSLPAAPKTNVPDIAFSPVISKARKIKIEPIQGIDIKPFAKVKSTPQGLPRITPVTVPDAYEEWKRLLAARKDDGTAEGAAL
jgi:hypothetical protein